MAAMKKPGMKKPAKKPAAKGGKGAPEAKPMKGAFGKMLKETNLNKGNR